MESPSYPRHWEADVVLRDGSTAHLRPIRPDDGEALVKGSTALAERFGDECVHAVVASVFFDIDQPILEYGGEVYSYVGDELIASWPLE